jgi:hypothetical protein
MGESGVSLGRDIKWRSTSCILEPWNKIAIDIFLVKVWGTQLISNITIYNFPNY